MCKIPDAFLSPHLVGAKLYHQQMAATSASVNFLDQ
jgi:hypothetical protein